MPQRDATPTIVFMHPLGGSAESWAPVAERLADKFRCVRLDLPGFGNAATAPGQSVAGMADWIETLVSERVAGPYVLVGHSMSAKIALLIARRIADCSDRPADGPTLVGLVLAAGSPPSPEPMADSARQQMLGYFRGDAQQTRREAEEFIRNNVAEPLPAPLQQAAVCDVERCSPEAWRRWLTLGSEENLAGRIAIIDVPALVLAGREDEALGVDAQRTLMLPHLKKAPLEIIDSAAHLLPLEQPREVAAFIASFVDDLRAAHLPAREPERRMTSRTMDLLEERMQTASHSRADGLDEQALSVLRRLLAFVLPIPADLDIDIAGAMNVKLADDAGDGWRFADLPPDREACMSALTTLDAIARRRHGKSFATLDDKACEAIVQAIEDGDIGERESADELSATGLQLWLKDLRGDACQIFVAHPLIQARANILAEATGGDSELLGFARVGAGESEAWENDFWERR